MNTIDDSWVQAYWYACGYNDFRLTGEPYVSANDFAMYWQKLQGGSRPSMQDAFQAFAAQVIS